MIQVQTHEATEQWRLVLQALGEESRTFSATLRSRPALQEFLRCAIELVEGDGGSIMLLVNEGVELEIVAADGPRADTLLGKRRPLSESIAGLAVKSGEPVVLRGRADEISAFPRDFSWSVVIPMLISGRMIGVMSVNCEDAKTLDPSVNDLLTLLSRQAGIFLETSRLYEELDRKQKRLEVLLDRLLERDETHSAADRGPERRDVATATSLNLARANGAAGPEDTNGFQERLTRREHQVLSLLVEGNSNKEIAEALSISLATVKSHVRGAIGKLGALDRTQAAVMALRRGLVT